MSREAMKLALEALEPFTTPNWAGTGVDKANEAYAALRQALANEALDKKAENARELGLDYEPAQQKQKRWAVFCQGCRKEWSVSYPHPGKSICADCDDKLAQCDASQRPAQQQEPVATNKVYVTREQLAEIYPPASKPWVGLTDEERFKVAEKTGCMSADWLDVVKATETALQIKNQ